MNTITIPKKEYEKLLDRALRYEYLKQVVGENTFASPPTRDMKTVMKEFRGVKRYSAKFLKSLGKGLKRSTYFK